VAAIQSSPISPICTHYGLCHPLPRRQMLGTISNLNHLLTTAQIQSYISPNPTRTTLSNEASPALHPNPLAPIFITPSPTPQKDAPQRRPYTTAPHPPTIRRDAQDPPTRQAAGESVPGRHERDAVYVVVVVVVVVVVPQHIFSLAPFQIQRRMFADGRRRAMTACWASSGPSNAGCAAVEQSLRECMDAPVCLPPSLHPYIHPSCWG
jgi:hypothetical protein